MKMYEKLFVIWKPGYLTTGRTSIVFFSVPLLILKILKFKLFDFFQINVWNFLGLIEIF